MNTTEPINNIIITLNPRQHGSGFRLDPNYADMSTAGRALTAIKPEELEQTIINLFLHGPIPEYHD